jgi:hypothetical protein
MAPSGMLRRVTLVRTTEPWFLQEPHGVTSQKTPFFIVTVVQTSNLTGRRIRRGYQMEGRCQDRLAD